MDEILFRISHQLEILQIQLSMIGQNVQQLLSSSLSQGQNILQSFLKTLHLQNAKDVTLSFFHSFYKELKKFCQSISSFFLNTNFIIEYLKNLPDNLQVSKREAVYFLTGILIGSITGYIVLLCLNSPVHMHNMKAIVCCNYLGIEGVTLIEDAHMPSIQNPDELLIQVKAASIHEEDINISSGYSRAYRRLLNTGRFKDLPVILGRDCAGIVVDIGCKVVDFDIGDKVFLAVPSWSVGTMAEYIVVPKTRVSKMPKMLPFEASACLPYSGCLVLHALKNVSIIREGNAKGKRILVCGGSSSLGCILIQILKLWGGYTVTTCRRQALPVLKALGANEVIALDETDIYKELELQDKFDVIFYTGVHSVDEKLLKKHLNYYGSYVCTLPENLISDSFGYITGSLFAFFIKVRLLFHVILNKNKNHWKEGSKIKASYLKTIQELVDADQLQPILDRVYSSDCIDQALSHVIDANAIGSTVVKF